MNPTDGGVTACPSDLPRSCPSPAPSYRETIGPLIEVRCSICHTPGGAAGERSLKSYSEVKAQKSAILDQVYACRMPPEDARSLAPAERSDLLAWLICGAPAN